METSNPSGMDILATASLGERKGASLDLCCLPRFWASDEVIAKAEIERNRVSVFIYLESGTCFSCRM